MAVVPMELVEPSNTEQLSELLQITQNLSVVDRRQYKEPLHVDEGVVWFDEYTINDGTRYRELTGVASKQIADASIEIGTPWMTCEEGHNLRTLLRFMSVGMSGRLIGPPRMWVSGSNPYDSLKNTIEEAKEVSLIKDAYNFLLILNAHDHEAVFKYNFEQGESFYYGESRGAMMGFGVKAMSEQFGRTIYESELVDPCLAEETDMKALLNTANVKKALSEVKSFGALVLAVTSESRRKYYRHTIDPSLEYIIPAFTTWNALSNGDAGKMASALNLEDAVDITFYSQSVANQQVEYRNRLKNHPNVHFFEESGGHLGLAERTSIFAPIGRIVVAQDQLKTNGVLYLPDIWQAAELVA